MDQEKEESLKNAMKQIEKDYGKGAIMRLGDAAANMNVEVISTGILPLDIALGVGGIAISLGCQDTISNLVGGLQVSLAGIVTPGDFIEVGGKRGIVSDVNWRYTRIQTMAGEMIVIPNAMINSQAVMHLPPLTCVKVPLRIWNTSRDLNTVAQEILDAVKAQVKGIIIDPEQNTPRLVFGDTSDYTFGATLTVDVEEGVDYSLACDQALRAAAPFLVPEGSNENA